MDLCFALEIRMKQRNQMNLWILLILFGVYERNMAIMVDRGSPIINLDDILNEDFMPMSVFQSEKNKYFVDSERLNIKKNMNIQPLITGDIIDAYDLMKFHRCIPLIV